MVDSTSRAPTQTLDPTQPKIIRTRMPFEAIHVTCLGDVVLQLQMEYPVSKPNNLASHDRRAHSLPLGQYVHMQVSTVGLSANLL